MWLNYYNRTTMQISNQSCDHVVVQVKIMQQTISYLPLDNVTTLIMIKTTFLSLCMIFIPGSIFRCKYNAYLFTLPQLNLFYFKLICSSVLYVFNILIKGDMFIFNYTWTNYGGLFKCLIISRKEADEKSIWGRYPITWTYCHLTTNVIVVCADKPANNNVILIDISPNIQP